MLKTRFIFLILSHEIRNPLNGIKGVLENLLTSTNLSDEQREDIQGARSASEFLRSLVDDVLDIKKIQDGSLRLHPEPVDLKRFTASNSPVRRTLAKQKGLEFLVEVQDSMPRFLIFDRLRVNQIITNVFSNAVKFTHKGLIKITGSY